MRITTLLRGAAIALAALSSATSAATAQTVINFDTLATGTSVSNQYPGVAFSIDAGFPTIGQTAAGNNAINSTSSGTRYLRGPTYGGDIPRPLDMTFTTLKSRVRFNLGLLRTTDGVGYQVYAFDAANAPIASLTVLGTIAPANTGRIDVPISVGAADGTRNIKKITIYTLAVNTVCIDDLALCDEANTTDPVIILTEPASFQCVCSGQTVSVSGTIDASGGCGSHASDLLEYRSATTGSPWTTIAGPYSSLPNGGDAYTGLLYSFSVPASLPGGYYFFRAKVYNDAGRSGSEVFLLYVDRSAPSISVTQPADNAIVRSNVCIIGQISDTCSAANLFDFRPSAAGAFTGISGAGASFPNLFRWNTLSLVDGFYELRIRSTDGCGNASTLSRTLVVDNTAPVARLDLMPCSYVSGIVAIRGQATDLHLAGWTLQYTGGDSVGWTTIANGTSALASGGLIANWDTRALRNCAYTLRLIVTDSASNQCDVGGGGGGNSSEALVSVNAGCAADFNRSGSVSVQDIFDFLAAYFAGCP